VKVSVAWVGKTKEPAIQALTDEYLKRTSRYAEIEGFALKDEAGLVPLISGARNRPKHFLVLLDSRGKQFSSEELAEFLRQRQESSSQPLVFAIGGADGFSVETRKSAGFILSLGKMTLPHELARVVLLEQIYRAYTILSGHPYHSGH
jgi:23S rRNA (pseudouridine1915-N3)-methyltransferase